MTQQEHNLMIAALTAQFQFSLTLFEILKTNGMATDNDLKPFYELVQHEAGHQFAVAQKYRALYQQQASTVGLKID